MACCRLRNIPRSRHDPGLCRWRARLRVSHLPRHCSVSLKEIEDASTVSLLPGLAPPLSDLPPRTFTNVPTFFLHL
jgi:hypothetical protein